MKNILSIISLLCVSLIMQAQSITTIEYYFDKDPGFGKGEELPTTTEIETSVDISGLENGVHQLYIRAKDSNNKWSLLQHRTFIKGITGVTDELPELSRVEYYIDDDPGLGYGLPIDITTDEAVYNVSVDNFQADLSTIEDGVHTIYIRAQDSNGYWSLLQHRTFIKGVVGVTDATPEIAYLEYYIDDDPGLGQGESMNFDADGLILTDIRSNYEIDVSNWVNGVHTIYIRAKDSNDHWSMIQSRTFIKFPLTETPKITEVEVKIEGIEPYNDWTSLSDFMPDACITTEFAIIEMCDLPNGAYIIQARATDDQQRTGPITDELLEIDCRTPQIKLKLNDGKIYDDEPLVVTGEGFKSNCNLDILIAGVFTGERNNYETTTDEDGNFEFNLVMPTKFEEGLYSIEVSCDEQDNNPRAKLFEYAKTNKPSLINIISPSFGDEVNWENVCIFWNDVIKGSKQYSDVLEFKKQVEYDIYYTSEGLNEWIFLKTYTDKVFPSKYLVNFKTCVDIPLEGNIQIKVENKKDNTLFDESESFVVYGLTQSVYEVEFLWDKSFPIKYVNAPLGVASDGVARIILQLNDYTGVGNIQNVEVSLSDPKGGATSINMLGKVMTAKADIIDYSNEANSATETTALCNNGDCGNENQFNFWYVAPEDFSENSNYYYDQASERFVTATFTLTFSEDVEPVIADKTIKIVRPPLLLVHGLGGDPSTWDNFSSERKDGTKVKFIDDNRFRYKKPIKIYPTTNFENNANLLLSNGVSSLVGNIEKMRELGYACNQVNYVGHSMGGVVIRVAEEDNFKFRSDQVTNNEFPYSSYGEGFVNRLITINSPHNGSEFADILVDLSVFRNSPQTEDPIIYRLLNAAFIFYGEKLYYNEVLGRPEDAILDLRALKGYNQKTTNLYNHLISSSLFTEDNCLSLVEVEEWEYNLALTILYLLKKYSMNSELVSILDEAERLTECEFLKKSDGVVSLSSQLAGQIEALAGQNEDTKHVSFEYGISHSEQFERITVSAKNSLVNGNKVFELLNYGLENDFSPIIPAKDDDGVVLKNNSQESKIEQSNFAFTSNPEGLEIINPTNEEVVFIDSLVNIKVHLKDTVGLVYADVTFQDEFLSFTNINDTLINKTIVISDQYLGKQNLTVTGIYNYSDSTSLAIETITLDVQAKELPVDLIIEPAINYGFSGERISPSYFAIFPTFVSELKSTNTDISVEIENEDVLTFNKNNNTFTGKAEGETFAIIKYFDTADTAQFIIYSSYEKEDSTDIIDSVISYETIEEKVFNVYPNPAENVLNIDYSLSETADVEFQVVDILGRNVLKFNSDYIQSNEIKTELISLTKVPAGIYIIYLNSNKGKISSRKIIVNK